MKFKAIFLYMFFFIASITILVAQDTCYKANINLGCMPLKIKMLSCKNDLDSVQFNFGTDKKIYSSPDYTFTKAGIYDITVYIYVPNFKKIVLKNAVTVVDAKAPKFKITNCSSSRIKLEITDTINQFYNNYVVTYDNNTRDTIGKSGILYHSFADTLPKTINIKGQVLPLACGADTTVIISDLYNIPIKPIIDSIISNNQKHTAYLKQYPYFTYKWQSRDKNNLWQTLNSWKGSSINSPVQLNASTDSVIYRISNYDICDNKEFYVEDLVMPYFTLIAKNQSHNIDYSTSIQPNNNKTTELYKNNISISKTSNPVNYTDTDVFCGVDYCYRGVYVSVNNAVLKGTSKCVKASSNIAPQAPLLINAGLNNAGNFQFDLNIDPKVKVAKYNLFSSEGTANFTKENTFTSTQIESFGKENMCYKISIEDSCNNTSALSEKVCPVWLNGSSLGQVDYKLSFNNYIAGSQTQPTKLYFVEYLQLDGTPYKSEKITVNFFNDNTPDTISSITRYRIKTQVSGKDYYSNIVERKNPMKINFPSAFTPNGDGINDVFFPAQRFVTDFKLWIYSQTGNTIFYTDDINKTWSGDNWPTGDYVYEYLAKDLLGNEISKKGIITLLR